MHLVITWAVLTAYLTGYLLSIRPLAARTLDNILRATEAEDAERRANFPSLWEAENPDGPRVLVPTDSGRIRATWYAFGKAIFWPIIIPVHMVARTVVSPTERLRAAERENARLRTLAENEGLTWPETNGDER